MIERREGNILEAQADALVNTVNCVGVMGRGIALQFREAYPDNYQEYRAACEQGEVQPGRMLIHDRGWFNHPRFIINFPTKRHWRGKSRMEDIEAGLIALVEEVRRLGIRSIAIPPLGSGLGGLMWAEVRQRIEEAFVDLPDVHLFLYEPTAAPFTRQRPSQSTPPRMTIGRAVLLGLMRRYLAAVMDPTVSLLELHKLMYFMQEAGEPLKLQYTKGHYGPYAENLRHVLHHIEGHFVRGFEDNGEKPDTPIEPEWSAVAEAERFLDSHPAARDRFDAVARLIEGFETPYGMELLATAHWVAKHEEAGSVEEAIALTHQWNPRKATLPSEHIHVAWDALATGGWLPVF